MKRLPAILMALATSTVVHAQVDTINYHNPTFNFNAFREGKASYAVFFTDSAGNRLTSADIWDRRIQFEKNKAGENIYKFEWKWYRKDSLMLTAVGTGLRNSLEPRSYDADYPTIKRELHVVYANDVASVPVDKQRTARDSAMHVSMSPAGFQFPMDVEIFPLLPFQKVGQKFAIAFYEPGGATSSYYPLTVTRKEDLQLPGGAKVNCWVLRIDYAPDSYASFWIADKNREVLKMQEYYKGRYRYKVRLY